MDRPGDRLDIQNLKLVALRHEKVFYDASAQLTNIAASPFIDSVNGFGEILHTCIAGVQVLFEIELGQRLQCHTNVMIYSLLCLSYHDSQGYLFIHETIKILAVLQVQGNIDWRILRLVFHE